MIETTNKSRKYAFLEVTAVWFGTHVGGGFASGNQTMNFFVSTGVHALWAPLISLLIVGLVFRASMLVAVENETYGYRDWAKRMYAPSKIMPIFYEICFLLIAIVGVSTSVAGAASLLQEYGLPYLVGICLAAGVFFILTIFGAGLIRKASFAMTIVMAVLMLIVYITGIAARPEQLVANITSGEAAPLGTTIYKMLQYAGYQSAVGATTVAVCKVLRSRRDVNKTFVTGYVLNAGMLFLSVLMLIAWKDVSTGTTLPTLAVIQNLGIGGLVPVYSLVLCLAFISTGTTCAFGFVTRFETILTAIKSLTTRRVVLSLGIIVFGTFLSLAGLTKLVMIGYGYTGLLAIPFVIIPIIVLDIVRGKKLLRPGTEHQEGA